MAIAAEMGWMPSDPARALSRARSATIGFCVVRPAASFTLEPFITNLLTGMNAETVERGLGLLVQIVDSVEAEVGVYRRWWSTGRVDGVVLMDHLVDEPRFDVLRELGLPAVVAGGPSGVEDFTHVWTDDFQAMTMIIDYLATLGHRRIARVAGVEKYRHTATRTQAFAQATGRLKLNGTATVSGDFTTDLGSSATRALLTRPERPTAIVYDDDVTAVAGLAVAHELGLRVPDEVSLVAWDDSALCRLVHPQVTAMSRDVVGFGRHLISRLVDVVEGGRPGSFRDSTPRFIPRGTTSRAPVSRS
jgi:DNA-binding LacI/PurR family transcriptional regulator